MAQQTVVICDGCGLDLSDVSTLEYVRVYLHNTQGALLELEFCVQGGCSAKLLSPDVYTPAPEPDPEASRQLLPGEPMAPPTVEDATPAPQQAKRTRKR